MTTSPPGPPAPGPYQQPEPYQQPGQASPYQQPGQASPYQQPGYGETPAGSPYGESSPGSPYGEPAPGGPYGEQPQRKGTDPLAIFGLILAFLAPLIGLILSLIALGRTGKGKRGGRGLAVAGTIVSGVFILGAVILMIVLFAAASQGDEEAQVDAAIESAIEDASEELVSEAVEEAPVDDAAADPAAQVPPANVGNIPAQVAPVGTTATVAQFDVTVTGVTLDGAERLAAANPANGPATGQYVLVDMTVTYNGIDTGTVWLELTGSYIGADGVDYGERSCSSVVTLPGDPFGTAELSPGETVQVTYCYDVAAGAAAGGTAVMESTFSLDESDRFGWQ